MKQEQETNRYQLWCIKSKDFIKNYLNVFCVNFLRRFTAYLTMLLTAFVILTLNVMRMVLFTESERTGEEAIMARFKILYQQSLKGIGNITESIRLTRVVAGIQTRHL
jgi:uncharacterized membrane protein YqjE